MRVRNQVIVVVAVFVAVLALAANALAVNRAVEQRAENQRIAAAAAWAEPLGTSTAVPASAAPNRSESGEPSAQTPTEPVDDVAQNSRSREERCDKSEDDSEDFRNHGCEVSSVASDKEFKDEFKDSNDGPLGAEISEIARSNAQNAAPGQDKKDESTPPGQDKKDESTPPGQDKKDKGG